jgi:hypothetical protein
LNSSKVSNNQSKPDGNTSLLKDSSLIADHIDKKVEGKDERKEDNEEENQGKGEAVQQVAEI